MQTCMLYDYIVMTRKGRDKYSSAVTGWMRTHGEKEMLSAEDLTHINTHVHMLSNTHTHTDHLRYSRYCDKQDI